MGFPGRDCSAVLHHAEIAESVYRLVKSDLSHRNDMSAHHTETAGMPKYGQPVLFHVGGIPFTFLLFSDAQPPRLVEAAAAAAAAAAEAGQE